MSDAGTRPNTLKLAEGRKAHQPDAPFAPVLLYVDHIVAALPSKAGTTLVALSTGIEIEVNMAFEKFATRQMIDKASS